MKTVTAKFKYNYSTDNKHRFDEVDESGNVIRGGAKYGRGPKVGALYLGKKHFGENTPTKDTTITATISIG